MRMGGADGSDVERGDVPENFVLVNFKGEARKFSIGLMVTVSETYVTLLYCVNSLSRGVWLNHSQFKH